MRRSTSSSFWLEKKLNREALHGSQMGSQRQLRIKDGSQMQGIPEHGCGTAEQRKATATVARLGRQRRWEEALAVFSEVSGPDPVLRAATLDACAKSMRIQEARRLFDEMPQKTISAYSPMITLLVRSGHTEDGEALLQEMRQNGITPNETTFSNLITSYSHARLTERALAAFDRMEASGVRPTEMSYAAVLAACGRAADPGRAQHFLGQMEDRGLRVSSSHASSVIGAHLRRKDERGARAAFEDVRRRGLQLDVIMYTMLIDSISGPGALERAEPLLLEMRQEAVIPDAFAYNALLRHALDSPAAFRRLLGQMGEQGLRHTQATAFLVRSMEKAAHSEQLSFPREEEETPECQLPRGWQSALDPAGGRPYYWQESDPIGTTTWDRPR